MWWALAFTKWRCCSTGRGASKSWRLLTKENEIERELLSMISSCDYGYLEVEKVKSRNEKVRMRRERQPRVILDAGYYGISPLFSPSCMGKSGSRRGLALNSHPVTAVEAWGLVRGAVALDKPPIRSSPVTSRIQPPKLICIVPSNSACVCGWVGERAAAERERRGSLLLGLLAPTQARWAGAKRACEALRASRCALGRQSGPDATRAASPRGSGQSGRRRGVQAAAAPQPLSLPSR